MSKFSRLVVAAAAALSFQAHADLLIDDFTISQATAISSVDGAGVWTHSTSGNNANILGGQRDLFAQRDSGPDADSTIKTSAGGGALRFSQDSDTRGTGIVRWDGDNTGAAISTATTTAATVRVDHCRRAAPCPAKAFILFPQCRGAPELGRPPRAANYN